MADAGGDEGSTADPGATGDAGGEAGLPGDPGAGDPGATDPGAAGDDPAVPPSDACVADCLGRECGDDGCGGVCGACDDGETCESGLCVAPSCGDLFPTCLAACAVRADCGVTGAAAGGIYDADNYACQDGGCVWQGCNSDAECAVDGGQPGQATKCLKNACGPATCRVTCAQTADCVAPGTVSVLMDADNWACEAGLCVWRGCTSTAECRAAYQGIPNADAYVCVPYDGFSTCVAGCQAAVDCVGAASLEGTFLDADNYACEDGLCRFNGCNSTAECVATYKSAAYMCVAPKYGP
jgi:hypothetical protein